MFGGRFDKVTSQLGNSSPLVIATAIFKRGVGVFAFFDHPLDRKLAFDRDRSITPRKKCRQVPVQPLTTTDQAILQRGSSSAPAIVLREP